MWWREACRRTISRLSVVATARTQGAGGWERLSPCEVACVSSRKLTYLLPRRIILLGVRNYSSKNGSGPNCLLENGIVLLSFWVFRPSNSGLFDFIVNDKRKLCLGRVGIRAFVFFSFRSLCLRTILAGRKIYNAGDNMIMIMIVSISLVAYSISPGFIEVLKRCQRSRNVAFLVVISDALPLIV